MAPALPERTPRRGRHRVYAYREMLNAIFAIVRSGCTWRMCPDDVPPWQTVSHSVRFWQRDGTWVRIHAALRTDVRVAAGREAAPSAAILDSQSVTTTEKRGPRGADAGNNLYGRTRHLLVDPVGVVVTVVVHAADIQDRDGARLVVDNLHGKQSHVWVMWADGGDAGQVVEWVQHVGGWPLDSSKRPDGVSRFHVLPRRWVVERTVAWLGRYRRLRKDDDARTATSEAFIYVAMIHVMVRRLARIDINDSS
ncbi:IS5 family transposase [Chloroflexus sp. MS-CIW-1]|uniref:IS5 family transposase n=1 Tax=Chloroflexus sp. MS-CIW-1 TaxID=3055768 RepID=UPI003463449E